MSSQPDGLAEPKASSRVPKITTRRKRRVDHAEIARMAEVEAANRAAERREMVAVAAYYLAEKRGFEPGHELEDWYAAEQQIAEAQQRNLMQ